MLWTKTGNTKGKKFIECKCSCGLVKWVKVANYGICSFGCRKCRFGKSNTTHGMAETPIYRVFNTMHDRCYLKSSKSYSRYGGRGIFVCKDWHTFELFLKWSNEAGYKKGLTIDRIDNDGNYEPSNCRWVTAKEQARNTSANTIIEHNGETKILQQWIDDLKVNRHTVMTRLRRGKTYKQALGLEI